jgi:ATP-dependent RNA helicase DeaD
MSATFPPSVQSMARRYQHDPLVLTCDDPQVPHGDIDFRIIDVWPDDRLSALINLLLLEPDAKTLVFVRTRAGASDLTGELVRNGFPARLLSGELSQGERSATLTSFRFNGTKVLVATDVAARGLDVPDIAQVVHMDLPDNPELLTHRSGRTGRAGRKGTCTVMVSPRGRRRLDQMLRSAGIKASRAPVPSPLEIHKAADRRLLESFTEEPGASDDPRFETLAAELLAGRDPVRLVAELLARGEHGGPCQPRSVEQPRRRHDRSSTEQRSREQARTGWVRFQVSWGRCHGADERRLLAVVCRRGGVRSKDVGSIAVGERSSMVEVSERMAQAFARAATRPDQRDPRVRFRRWQDAPGTRQQDRRTAGR